MKFNRGEIMRNAWKLFKNSADDTFGYCLALSWKNAKNEPTRVVEQWSNMTETQKYNMLMANVKKAAKDEIRYSVEDRYSEFNESVAWVMRGYSLDGFVNDAFLKLVELLNIEYLETLNKKRQKAGKNNISLVSLVYRAALYSISAVYRQEIKHVKARFNTITDADGEEYQYIDTMVSSRADSTETAALSKIALDDFINNRDDIDRIIIKSICDGYTSKEIAQIIGISEPAICKRLKKIRAAAKVAEIRIA